MALLLGISGVAFVAFWLWLTVRVVNRPEQRVKLLAVALIVTMAAYPLMVGA